METEQVWRYKLKLNDPPQAREALEEMLKDVDEPLTELDIEDDFNCPVKGCVVYQNGKEELIALDKKPIHIDYKSKEIKLPEELIELYKVATVVPASHVRYVSMPIDGFDSELNNGTLVVMSLWDSARDIVNMNLLAKDAKEAMLLLNAVTRLVYESSDKNGLRTHKFYRLNDGPVNVAFCTAAERDARDEEKERQGLARKQTTEGADEGAQKSDEQKQDLPELITTPKFYVFDEEALLMYDNTFSSVPDIDLRFYREQLPKTIETIFVCILEQQLEIQQGDKVFFISPKKGDKRSVEAYKRLVKFLRNGRVKPKSEACFKGTGSDFAKIFAVPEEVPDTYETDTDEELGDLKGNPIVNALPRKKRDKKGQAAEPRSSGPAETTTKVRDTTVVSDRTVPNEENVKGRTWLENICNGNHVMEVAKSNEQMQIDWFAKEAELEKIIKNGAVPEIDPNALGSNWDPKSLNDMCKALNLVRDCIMTNKYADALARLCRCLSVFDETLLQGVEVEVGLVEIMKRIYFLKD